MRNRRESGKKWQVIMMGLFLGLGAACSPIQLPPASTPTETAAFKEKENADPENLPAETRLVIPPKKAEVSVTPAAPEVKSAPAAISYHWPVAVPNISSGFGGRRAHAGLDIRAIKGTNIYATAAGIVKFTGWISGYGNVVELQHTPEITSRYAHNSANLVKTGDVVQQGQLIAQVGRTGNATGNHVHFEIRIKNKSVNPQKYLPPLPADKSLNVVSAFP